MEEEKKIMTDYLEETTISYVVLTSENDDIALQH